MLRPHLLILWLLASPLSAQSNKAKPDGFDLVTAYQVSTHVFYGEISKVLPERNFKTGKQGVYLKNVNQTELSLEPVVWPKSKVFTFTVEENFKSAVPEGFEAHLPKANPDVWTYIETDLGDTYLAKPYLPEEKLEKLYTGDKGLFFIRQQAGSTLPILYRYEVGKIANESIALLRADASNPNVNLAQVVEHMRLQKQKAAAKEAAEFKIFEEEYYKILRIRELEIRQSLLEELVTKMGYEGHWDYFSFKERYLLDYGDHIKESEIPSGPSEGKEKLWDDISGELKKIEMILKLRQ